MEGMKPQNPKKVPEASPPESRLGTKLSL